jgi:hypothetical protein
LETSCQVHNQSASLPDVPVWSTFYITYFFFECREVVPPTVFSILPHVFTRFLMK